MFSHRIVVSAITYSEMRFGASGPKASPRHVQLVDKFCPCLDAILSWDRAAVDGTTDIKVALRQAGTPIGQNDTAIAGPEAGRLGSGLNRQPDCPNPPHASTACPAAKMLRAPFTSAFAV